MTPSAETDSAGTPSALGGTRVVDLSGGVAAAYCGKLFANFGAHVVNLERGPSGHLTRTLEPTRAGHSALFAYLSAGKQSVCGEPRAETCAATRRLVATADVVLFDSGEVDPQWLAAHAPEAIAVSLSWFGDRGPRAGQPGTDAVVAALIGFVRGIGPADGPPVLPSGYPCQMIAGATTFLAVLGQLIGRAASGARPFALIESNVLEASLCLTEPGPLGVLQSGIARPRLGVNRFAPTFPMSVYPCKDGHLGVTALTPSQWLTFCDMVGLQSLAQDKRYIETLVRLDDADLIEAELRPRLLERTAMEWFLEGQERKVPLALVPEMHELLALDQFRDRGAFCHVDTPLGRLELPGVPFRLHQTPAICDGRVPDLGEHQSALDEEAEPTHTQSTPPAAGALDPRQPLAGVRILDLGMGWAGPLAARHLGDLGAEIIKVESCQYFDWWRGWEVTEEMLEQRLYEQASSFLTVNRNKKAITLDLTRDEGRQLFRQLVESSDALLENYTGSVLPKMGLSEEQLRAWNPELVLLHMPPFGKSGNWRNFRAYGSTVEQASGLPHLQGHADWPPTMLHVALGDPIAGTTGAISLAVALLHKVRTGRGQTVDLSHVESLWPLGAHGFAEHAAHGAVTRRGSRHARHAPHVVLPCRNEGDRQDQWLVLTVESETHWEALDAFLRESSDTPAALLEELDGRFATERGRKEHELQLEQLLAEVSQGRDASELAAALGRAGVPAAPVLTALEVLHDEHLGARGFWQWHERRYVGSIPNPSAPYRISATPEPPDAPLEIRSPSPTLGEHNEEILGGLLGVDRVELGRLEADQIIGTVPVPKNAI